MQWAIIIIITRYICMRRRASRNNTQCNREYMTFINKNKMDTLLWLAGKNQLQDTTKATTRRTTTKICIVTRSATSAMHVYAGDREWLNARGKKSLRSARWHLCSLSLSNIIYLHTLAQIQPLNYAANYSPHAKALGNYYLKL